MSTNRKVKYGRTFTVELGPDEDVLRSVEAAVEENGVTDAVFLAGTGDLKNVRSHFAGKLDNGEYMDFPLDWDDAAFAVTGVQGFIEQGRVHLHAVIGNDEECWTIHFHEGCTTLTGLRLVFSELSEEG